MNEDIANDSTNDKIVNKLILSMFLSGRADEEILAYVKAECAHVHLEPKVLGLLFEAYLRHHYKTDPSESGFAPKVSIAELQTIHKDFRTTNGCQWARSDGSYLGNKYTIRRFLAGKRVQAIKLDGFNESLTKHRNIRADIVKRIQSCSCVNCGSHSRIEVDHKNGKYNNLNNISSATQRIEDFQPLCKSCNDVKRQHCKKCKETGKRFNASETLGYSSGYLYGDALTPTCQGCYWYDVEAFHRIISSGYVTY